MLIEVIHIFCGLTKNGRYYDMMRYLLLNVLLDELPFHFKAKNWHKIIDSFISSIHHCKIWEQRVSAYSSYSSYSSCP